MRKGLFAMMGLLLLSGCTDARMQFDQPSLQALKGQDVGAVKELLGIPQYSYVKEDKTYLIYTTTYENYTPPTATPYRSFGQRGLSGQSGSLGSYASASCITTFIVQKEIISDVKNQGNCL